MDGNTLLNASSSMDSFKTFDSNDEGHSNSPTSARSKTAENSLPPGLNYAEFRVIFLENRLKQLESSQETVLPSCTSPIDVPSLSPPGASYPNENLLFRRGSPSSERGSETHGPHRRTTFPSRLRIFFFHIWSTFWERFRFAEFLRGLFHFTIVLLVFPGTISFSNVGKLFCLYTAAQVLYLVFFPLVRRFLQREREPQISFSASIVRRIAATRSNRTARRLSASTTASLPTSHSVTTTTVSSDFYPVEGNIEKKISLMNDTLKIKQTIQTSEASESVQHSRTPSTEVSSSHPEIVLPEVGNTSPLCSSSPSRPPDSTSEKASLSRPFILLYCIFRCCEAFFTSLSPSFSQDEFEASLRADGILHFTD